MIGIILAAGNGTRMKKSSNVDSCKVLRKINDTYLIEFALKNLIELDVTDVFVVVGKDGENIKNAIGEEYNGLKITYVYQAQPKGLINALVQALNSFEPDDVVLQLADEIFIKLNSENIKAMVKANAYDFYYGVTYEDDAQKIKGNYSVETDENMLIKKCIEKPENIINNIKGTGFCIFRQNVLKLLGDVYNEADNTPNNLCDFSDLLVEKGKKGLAFFVAEKEFNINTATDLEQATLCLKN